MTCWMMAAAAIGMFIAPVMAQAPVRDGATWLVEAIRGRGVIANAQKTLRIRRLGLDRLQRQGDDGGRKSRSDRHVSVGV